MFELDHRAPGETVATNSIAIKEPEPEPEPNQAAEQDINFLGQADDDLPPITFRKDNAFGGRPRRHWIVLLSVTLGIGLAGAWGYTQQARFPNWWGRTQTTYHNFMQQLMATITGVPVRRKLIEKPENSVEVGAVSEQLLQSSGPCSEPLRTFKKTSPAGRIVAAECFLMIFKPQDALQLSTPFATVLPKVSTPLAIDGFSTHIMTLLRLWRVRTAENLVRTGCAGNDISADCIGKLLVLAEIGAHASGEAIFLRIIGSGAKTLAKPSMTRVWLAGAKLAIAAKAYKEAEQRLLRAQELITTTTPYYLSEALGIRAELAFHKGDRQIAEAVKSEFDKRFKTFNKAPKAKADLLADLLGPRKKALLLGFLNRNELNVEIKTELALFRIVSREAVRQGLGREYLSYLGFVRTLLTRNYQIESEDIGLLKEWEIRAHIANREWTKAISLSDQFGSTYGKGVIDQHLKGIALVMSANPQQALEAAREFQAAVASKANWQSLYGLCHALLKAKRPEKVPELIKLMASKFPIPEAQKWLALLQMDLMLSTAKPAAALANADRFVKKYPTIMAGWQLNRRALVAMGRKAEADALQQEILSKGMDIQSWDQDVTVQDPLGPIALLNQ